MIDDKKLEELLSERTGLDDNMLGRINESCNALSEEQKNRILGIIEKKESESSQENEEPIIPEKEKSDENEEKVSIIEYRRNYMRIIAPVAACVCLAAGIGFLTHNAQKNEVVPFVKPQITDVKITDSVPSETDITGTAKTENEAVPVVTEITAVSSENAVTVITAVTSEVKAESVPESINEENEKSVEDTTALNTLPAETIKEEEAPLISVSALNGLWKSGGQYTDTFVFEDGNILGIHGYTGGKLDGTAEIFRNDEGRVMCRISVSDGLIDETFDITGETSPDRLISSESSFSLGRLNNVSRDPEPEDYTGEWMSSHSVIRIEKDESHYEVKYIEGYSAFLTEEWTYDCVYDPVSKTLVCDGEGVKREIEEDGRGSILSEKVTETGCSAVFSMKYSLLTYDGDTSYVFSK